MMSAPYHSVEAGAEAADGALGLRNPATAVSLSKKAAAVCALRYTNCASGLYLIRKEN
jgi:hypothetical protein